MTIVRKRYTKEYIFLSNRLLVELVACRSEGIPDCEKYAGTQAAAMGK